MTEIDSKYPITGECENGSLGCFPDGMCRYNGRCPFKISSIEVEEVEE